MTIMPLILKISQLHLKIWMGYTNVVKKLAGYSYTQKIYGGCEEWEHMFIELCHSKPFDLSEQKRCKCIN